MNPTDRVFITVVRSETSRSRAALLVESIRAFGGRFKDDPVYVFDPSTQMLSSDNLPKPGVEYRPLDVPTSLKNQYYADKVLACAEAEKLVASFTQSLIWVASDCLFVNPPELLELGGEWDACVRPVHIQNVGLEVDDPVDEYWKGVYARYDISDHEVTVKSFIDQKILRAYYNSHAFSVDPSLGLMAQWLEHFQALATDNSFQNRACADDLRKVFLHQATLSTLVALTVKSERLRILPPEYSYPYNLHHMLPKKRRAFSLNELVSIAYENRSMDPEEIEDILIQEPLRSWLQDHLLPDRQPPG